MVIFDVFPALAKESEMKSTAVLILGADRNRDLVELLFDFGFAPLVRKTIREALDKLRHERFSAVIVDRNHADVDVLEFILNVRDLDEQTPVVVIGSSTDAQSDQVLLSQRQTFLLGAFGTPDQLANELEQVLMTGGQDI